jgi:hypothetical protein
MICARHDWWSADPCSKCEPAAVTAPVTPEAPLGAIAAETKSVCDAPETDLVSGAIAGGAEAGLEIPDFLLRNKDGTFAHPELMVHSDVRHAVPTPDGPILRERAAGPIEARTEAQLYAMLEDVSLSLLDRQPIYLELRAREDKKKSLARIAAMKEKKASKETQSCQSPNGSSL